MILLARYIIICFFVSLCPCCCWVFFIFARLLFQLYRLLISDIPRHDLFFCGPIVWRMWTNYAHIVCCYCTRTVQDIAVVWRIWWISSLNQCSECTHIFILYATFTNNAKLYAKHEANEKLMTYEEYAMSLLQTPSSKNFSADMLISDTYEWWILLR